MNWDILCEKSSKKFDISPAWATDKSKKPTRQVWAF